MGQLYEIGQVVGYVDLVLDDRATDFPISSTAKWFCAVTNPNCQARASLGLHELGYRTFYPKVRRWVSHARVRTARERPLLGRYIFVEVDEKNDQQSFYAVRAVNGIESIVSNPDPIAIPSAYITQLRERYMEGEWDFVRRENPCPKYKEDKKGKLVIAGWRWNDPTPIGARIKVMEGEFQDMLATITGWSNGKVEFKIFESTKTGKAHECSVRAA